VRGSAPGCELQPSPHSEKINPRYGRELFGRKDIKQYACQYWTQLKLLAAPLKACDIEQGPELEGGNSNSRLALDVRCNADEYSWPFKAI